MNATAIQLPGVGALPISINHLGYLSDDIDAAITTFSALGMTGVYRFDTSISTVAFGTMPFSPAQGTEGSPPGIRIELTMPTTPGNRFADRLEENGPGLDHFGITVPDFNEYLDALVGAGCIVTVDMRKAVIGTEGLASTHSGLEACFLDCDAIGFPNVEMFGP